MSTIISPLLVLWFCLFFFLKEKASFTAEKPVLHLGMPAAVRRGKLKIDGGKTQQKC